MPHRRVTGNRLIGYAKAMGEAALRHAGTFIATGLVDDFVDKLRAAADAVRESIDTRGQTRALRRSATEAVHDATVDATAIIGVVDGLVVPVLAFDAKLLADWQRVKRIEQKPGGAPKADSANPESAAA